MVGKEGFKTEIETLHLKRHEENQKRVVPQPLREVRVWQWESKVSLVKVRARPLQSEGAQQAEEVMSGLGTSSSTS